MFNPDPMLVTLLQATVDAGASDLHLSVGRPPTARRDGMLVPFEGVQRADAARHRAHGHLAARGLPAEELDEVQQVDFSFGIAGLGRFRANAFNQRNTLRAGAARRAVSASARSKSSVRRRQRIDLLNKPYGLVLVVGPTGSGKTTTLAAMIDRINATKPCHILTIEDPVEYLHHHKMAMVNQREVGTDVQSVRPTVCAAPCVRTPTSSSSARCATSRSISITLTLAETGHLVFATLHTNDASQALDRIVDVFPAERRDQIQMQLAGSLQGVISQRLLPADGGGRVAAYEVLMANDAVRNLLREGKTPPAPQHDDLRPARGHADHRDGPRPPRGQRHHQLRHRRRASAPYPKEIMAQAATPASQMQAQATVAAGQAGTTGSGQLVGAR